MIIYLLKSTICLALVLSVYKGFLAREKMLHFNRIFLLFGLLFAFIAPLIPIYHEVSIIESNHLTPAVIIASDTPPEVIQNISFTSIFVTLYLLVAGIFMSRFVYHLINLLQPVLYAPVYEHRFAKLVLVDDKISPHSFWNYIFINKVDFELHKIEDDVLAHELSHVRQFHSFDIVLIELLSVLFWINPFLPSFKKAIQLNHEFLADNQVLQNHTQPSRYLHLLLDKTAGYKREFLASNFNYLVTKKRLKMMLKTSSRMRTYTKALLTVPLFACLLFCFGNMTTAQSNSTAPSIDEYFKDATFICERKNGQKVYKPYKDLSAKEKALLPPLPPTDSNNLKPLPKGSVVHLSKNGMVTITSGEDGKVPLPPLPPAPPQPKAFPTAPAPPTPPVPPAPPVPATPKVKKKTKDVRQSSTPVSLFPYKPVGC